MIATITAIAQQLVSGYGFDGTVQHLAAMTGISTDTIEAVLHSAGF